MNAQGQTVVAAPKAELAVPELDARQTSGTKNKWMFWRILTVIRFEMRRTRTDARAVTWLIMVLFPVSLLFVYRLESEAIPDFQQPPEQILGLVLYGLVPQVICLLGLLLWVAPMLQAELEGRTWIYLAVRPGGKFATLIGKYFTGVAWTASAALFGLSLGMLAGQLQVSDPWRLWRVMVCLVCFACLAYGAAYAVIGALFHRRAMVVSVAYILIFEIVISNLPALINRFTVQHHLFNLLFCWMAWEVPEEFELLVGTQSASHHVAALVTYTLVMLTAAAVILRWRQYVTSDEN